ncbi:MAG: hypothetical protein AAGA30_04030 [Planctomycetota bacterium]
MRDSGMAMLGRPKNWTIGLAVGLLAMTASLASADEPGVFSVLSPSGFVTDNTPVIDWGPSGLPDDCVTSYRVNIATDPAVTNIVQTAIVVGQLNTEYQSTPLPPGQYYAGVTAIAANGSTVNANNNGLAFTVGPNPNPFFQHVIFVTANSYSVSSSQSFPPPLTAINGQDGACWHCTLAAFNSGLLPAWNGVDIVWHALLSDENFNANERPINAAVYNTMGQLVASSGGDLWDGELQNPVASNEFGAISGLTGVWTGSVVNGQRSNEDCDCWNSNSNSGTVGRSDVTNSGWIQDSDLSCSNSNKLYCISPLLPVSANALIFPDSIHVITGSISSGTVDELEVADDVYLQLSPGTPAAPGQPQMVVELTGDSQTLSPGSLFFRLETSANVTGVAQTAEFFNYITQQFESVSAGPADVYGVGVDQDLDINLQFLDEAGDLSRFVDAGSGEVKVRLSFDLGVITGDINSDGVVNLLDVGPFVDLISGGEFDERGDINDDGVVNLLDVGPFVDLISSPPPTPLVSLDQIFWNPAGPGAPSPIMAGDGGPNQGSRLEPVDLVDLVQGPSLRSPSGYVWYRDRSRMKVEQRFAELRRQMAAGSIPEHLNKYLTRYMQEYRSPLAAPVKRAATTLELPQVIERYDGPEYRSVLER